MMPFSDDELIEPVEDVLSRLRPSIAMDGGDIVLERIEGNKVFVRLKGACVGCPSSNNTLKNSIEKNLRLEIHPNLEVVSIN